MAGKPGRAGSAGKTSPIPHTRLEDDKQFDDYYTVGEKLGEGAFGVVREVADINTDIKWACKAINKEKAGSSKIKLLEREVSILKKVRHEHIIQLKQVFETPQKMYLVMELCLGGELSNMMKERSFSEPEVRTIINRLASAISYLHKNDMVHRDLKLENILMANNPNDSSDPFYIKVTDFGLSVVKDGVGHENMMMDFCGTPMYMAPEIIENKTYSEKCDVWAMGVIMCTLLTGTPPFHCGADEEKMCEILKTIDMKKRLDEDRDWKDISKEAKDCVIGMLTVDPAHRVTSSEVLDHAWIKGERLDENNPRNVLEMMREWKHDLANGSDSEDSAINGDRPSAKTKAEASHKDEGVSSSAPSSRGNSAGSAKQGKNSDAGRRTSYGPTGGASKPRRGLVRNNTEPTNLHFLATSPASGSTKTKTSGRTGGRTSQTGAKSKSPVDGLHVNPSRPANSTGRAAPKSTNHHTARPAATKTTSNSKRTSPDSQKAKDKRR